MDSSGPDKHKPAHMDDGRVDSEVARYTSEVPMHISEAENRRLGKLVDRRVLSIMMVTYFIQALDKGTLAFTSIMGIRVDAHRSRQAAAGGAGAGQPDGAAEPALPALARARSADVWLRGDGRVHDAADEWPGRLRQYHHFRLALYRAADAAVGHGVGGVYYARVAGESVFGEEVWSEYSRYGWFFDAVLQWQVIWEKRARDELSE
ncbi:hypothetical protein NHQ30_010670 [Ciborinia camelliae]|nr:hypothetical protein NHQ30_010670 [Ciborinia camelliae]